MTKGLSQTAMVLAAGLGMRMRPLTLEKPKPLQAVGGRTMLDHALDKLVAVGIKRAVVNVYHLAEHIETHLQARRDLEIVISREEEPLDTGGGVARALAYFEGKPFFALNADLPWTNGAVPSLARMQHMWEPQKMDVLLLVMQTQKARGFDPAKGDYAMDTGGRVWRKGLQPPRPYVYIGAQILKPEMFGQVSDKVFSNNKIFDLAEENNRLYGLAHEGTCYHVSTPDDLRKANELLESGQGWGV